MADDDAWLAHRFLKSCNRQAHRQGYTTDTACADLVSWAVDLHSKYSNKYFEKKRHRKTRDEKIERLRYLVEYHKKKHEEALDKLKELIENSEAHHPRRRLSLEAPPPLDQPLLSLEAPPPLEQQQQPLLSLEVPPLLNPESAEITRAKAVREERVAAGLEVSKIVGKNVKPECRRYKNKDDCGWPCGWLSGVADKTLMCRPAHRATQAGHRTPWKND